MRLEKHRVVTEVTVDNHAFKLTRESAGGGSCYILWVRDADSMDSPQPLGRFGSYDQRRVLEFVVRYVTSPALREELARRRFARYLESLSPEFLEDFSRSLDGLSEEEKVAAFKGLFDLESMIDAPVDLTWKRRCMAKKFHPDKGGDHRPMAVINEGYRILKRAGAVPAV